MGTEQGYGYRAGMEISRAEESVMASLARVNAFPLLAK